MRGVRVKPVPSALMEVNGAGMQITSRFAAAHNEAIVVIASKV